MSEILSFPGLGLEIMLNRIAFSVGSRPIYWYGIIVAAAFLCAAFYVLMRARAFGLDNDRVMDVILGAVLLGIIGARAYYVLFRWDTYSENPISALFIWEGGLAIYGGIIGGVAAMLLVCKWRRVKLLPMLDLAATGLLLGQAVGRWGNFVNMEAFGRNTEAAWGMTSDTIKWYLTQNAAELARIGVEVDPSMPVHPTFFYESIWCFLGFLAMAAYTKHRRFDGELWLMYLGTYGVGRFFIEGLRTDSLLLGTMRVSQMVALFCVTVSIVALVMIRSKIKRANDAGFMKLYVDTDEGKAVLAGEFYGKKRVAASGGVPAADVPEESDKEKASEQAEPETDPPEEPKEADAADSQAEAASEPEPAEQDKKEEPAQKTPEETGKETGNGENN